jgi:hypothetical protein
MAAKRVESVQSGSEKKDNKSGREGRKRMRDEHFPFWNPRNAITCFEGPRQ